MADKEPTPTPSRTDVPPLLMPPVAPPPPESDQPTTDEPSEEELPETTASAPAPAEPTVCPTCGANLEVLRRMPNPHLSHTLHCPHCGFSQRVVD